MIKTLCLSVSATALIVASPALACEKHSPKKPAQTELKSFGAIPHATPRPGADPEVPLWDNLGSATLAGQHQSAMAQRYFDQGLTLAFGFNHAEARRSFQAAQRLDPTCAMCFWGEALVLGPNINAPMDPAGERAGLRSAWRARRPCAAGASARERALIAALGARYSADPAKERAALDRAYADAMVAVAERFPDDDDIATLARRSPDGPLALGLLAGRRRGRRRAARPRSSAARARPCGQPGPRRAPSTSTSTRSRHRIGRSARSRYADRLRRRMPGAGPPRAHAVAHLLPPRPLRRFARGQHRGGGGRRGLLTQAKPEGIYAGGYYPHNIALPAGLGADGGRRADGDRAPPRSSRGRISDEARRAMPAFVQPIKAAPLFAHAQFSDPEVILALPEPPQRHAIPDGTLALCARRRSRGAAS